MGGFPDPFPSLFGVNELAPSSAAAYARQMKQLLPRGLLWRLDPDSWLSRLLLAIADEFTRVDGRADDLVDEWDPRTADETLIDWERVLGLPDGCVPLAVDTPARQFAVSSKLAARGGQTAAYYVSLAASLGFVATVAEIGPHAWRMDVDLSQSTSTDITGLECVIRRAAPAHTVPSFNYSGGPSGVYWGAPGLTWGAFTWGA